MYHEDGYCIKKNLFDYKGKPHVLSVVRDVTEQVQAEEQLREKEAQYRSIFEEELYRVAQEALHNTAKHARANNVNLRMHSDTGGVLLEVRDDGVGFDMTQSFPGHLGLQSMRERIARLGGTLQIESAPGQGTCIRAQLPASTRKTAQLLV